MQWHMAAELVPRRYRILASLLQVIATRLQLLAALPV